MTKDYVESEGKKINNPRDKPKVLNPEDEKN